MAWPRHGTTVDMGLLEQDGIFQCRKHAGEMAGLKPDLADSPVRKLNLERQRRNGFDNDNVSFHEKLSQISSVRLNRVNLQRKPILAWPSGQFYLVPI